MKSVVPEVVCKVFVVRTACTGQNWHRSLLSLTGRGNIRPHWEVQELGELVFLGWKTFWNASQKNNKSQQHEDRILQVHRGLQWWKRRCEVAAWGYPGIQIMGVCAPCETTAQMLKPVFYFFLNQGNTILRKWPSVLCAYTLQFLNSVFLLFHQTLFLFSSASKLVCYPLGSFTSLLSCLIISAICLLSFVCVTFPYYTWLCY